MIPNVVEHVGDVVVIRRNGKDGGRFPLRNSATIGRSESCDIRIQLQYVSRKHAELSTANEKVVLTNCSSVNPIMVNGEPVDSTIVLRHMDIFSIGDRAFRFEYLKPFHSDDEVNDEDPDRTCQLDPGLLPIAIRARMSGGMHMRPPRPPATAGHGSLKSKVSAENVAANEQALVGDAPVDAVKKTPVKKPQSPAAKVQPQQVHEGQVGIEAQPANPTRHSLMSQADVDRLVDDLVEGMRTSLRLSTPMRKEIESRRFSPASRSTHVPMADKENAEPEPDDMVPPSASRARLATPVRRAIESRLQSYPPRHPPSTAAAAPMRTAVTAHQQQQRNPLPTPIKEAIQSRRLSMPTPRNHHEQDYPQQQQESEGMPTDARQSEDAVEPHASAPRQQSLPTPMRQEMGARRRSYAPPSAAAADPAATDDKLDAPAFTQPARRMSTRSSTPSAAEARASAVVSASEAALEAMTAEPREDGEEEGRHPLEVTQRGWQRSSALPTPLRREIDVRRRSYVAPRRLSVEHVQEVVEGQPVCEGEDWEEDAVDDDEPRLINRAPLPTPVKRAIHSHRRSSYAVEPALPTVNEGETEDDFNAAFIALRAMNITPAAPRSIRPRPGFAAGASAGDAREGVVDSHASTPYKHNPASTRVSSVGPVCVPGASAPLTPAMQSHQSRLAAPIRTVIDARRHSYAGPLTTQTAMCSRGRYGLLDEESDEDGDEDDGEVTLGGSHQAEIFSDVIAPQQLHAEEGEADEKEDLVVEEGDDAKESFVGQRVMNVNPSVSCDGGRVAVKAQQAGDASDEAAQHVTRSMRTSLARDINSRRQSYRTRSASADADAAVRHNDAAIKAQLSEDGEDGYAEDALGDQRGITVTPAVPVGRTAQPQAATRRRLSVELHADGTGMDNDTAFCPPVAPAVRQSLEGVGKSEAFAGQRTERAGRVTRARPQSSRPPVEGAPARRSMTGAFVPSPVRGIAHSDDDVYEEELNNDAFIEQRDMDFTPAVAHRPRILRPRRMGHDDSDAFSEQRMMAVTPAVARTMRAREGACRVSQRAMLEMEGEHGSVEDAYADARMMTVTPMVPRTRSRRAPQTAEDDAFSEQRHMAFTPAPLPVRRSSRRQQQQAKVPSQVVPHTRARKVDDNPFFAQRNMTVTPAVPRRTTRRQQHTPAPAEGGGTVDPQVAPAAVDTPAMPTRSSTRRQQQQLQTPSISEQAETVAEADDEAYMPLRNIALSPAIVDRWRQQEYASVKEDDVSESDLELRQKDTFPEHRTADSTPAMPTRRSTRGQLSSAAHFKLQGAEAAEEEEDPYSEQRNMAFTPAVPTRRHTRSQRKTPAVSKEEAAALKEEGHDPLTEQRNMAVTPAVPARRSTRTNNQVQRAREADDGHDSNDENDDDAFESHRAMAMTPAMPTRRNNVRTAAVRPRTASHHAAANGDAHEDADPFAEHRAMTVTPMPRRVTRSAAAAAPARAAAAAASHRSGAMDADDDEVIRAMANTPSESARGRAQGPLPTTFRRSGASRRSSVGKAREQRHDDNGDIYAEDEGGGAFEEQRVMAVTPAVQRDGRPVRPRAQRPVFETVVRVSDEMDAEEKGADGDVASEQFSVGEYDEGDDDAFVEQRAMAGYTPAAPVKRPSSGKGEADSYAEEEGETEKPTQRRRSLLEELGESNRIEEELPSGAEEAADLRMLQSVSHAMSRDSGVQTGAAFSAAMDAFLEDPPRFPHEAQPIVDQHDCDAAGGQTSIEEVEGMAARDGMSSEDVQSSDASPPSDGQVSREPQTDDDDGQICPPQQQQRQEGPARAEQGRLSTTDGDRTESNSTAESSDVMPAYVREDLMAVRDAAEALRGDVDGALSPSTAYDVAMDRYMEDPEAFRRRMAAGNGLWSPGVNRATDAHRPSGQGHISPLTGDSSPASASQAASGESQTFMQILKYLKTVRHSPNKDHDNEEDGVSQIKPQPMRAERGGGLPTPMLEGLATSLPAPSPPSVGSPEPRSPVTGREGGDHSSPFKGALATDLRLVELYAKEMAEVGRVPADYAWTVALDTYLADRGAFRQHLGSLLADVEAPSDSNGTQLPNGTRTDEDADHVLGDAPCTQHSEGLNTEEEEEGGHDSRHHSHDEESEDEGEEAAVPARGATSPNTRKTRTTRGRAAASASTTTNRRTPMVSSAAGGVTRKGPTTPSVGSIKKTATRARALDHDDEGDDDDHCVAGRSPSPVVLTKRGTRKMLRESGQQRNLQRQVQHVTQQQEEEDEEELNHAPRASMAAPRDPVAAELSSSSEADEGGRGGGEVLILCDGCDGEFALHEVGLMEVPDGDWYCGACRPKHTAAAKRATRKAVAAAAGGASDVQTERTLVRGKRATSKKDITSTTSTRTRRAAAAAAAAATSSSAPSTAERPKRSGRSVARAKGH